MEDLEDSLLVVLDSELTPLPVLVVVLLVVPFVAACAGVVISSAGMTWNGIHCVVSWLILLFFASASEST